MSKKTAASTILAEMIADVDQTVAEIASATDLAEIAQASEEIDPLDVVIEPEYETPKVTSVEQLIAMVNTAPAAPVPVAPIITRITPPEDRKYVLIAHPTKPFRGMQREIVYQGLKLINEHEGPATLGQVVKVVKGTLEAKAGVMLCTRYHLHHLYLLGYAKILNPTFEG
jgi:hypothetical protein